MFMANEPTNNTPDFLLADPFPARPTGKITAASFEATVSRALSRALKDVGRPRAEVAAEMVALLEEPSFSEGMLNNYASESKTEHNIGLKRFTALVRVTGAVWLLDLLAEQVGCRVVHDKGVVLAQLGAVDQQIRALSRRRQRMEATLTKLSGAAA